MTVALSAGRDARTRCRSQDRPLPRPPRRASLAGQSRCRALRTWYVRLRAARGARSERGVRRQNTRRGALRRLRVAGLVRSRRSLTSDDALVAVGQYVAESIAHCSPTSADAEEWRALAALSPLLQRNLGDAENAAGLASGDRTLGVERIARRVIVVRRFARHGDTMPTRNGT